jgi:hypothetical protein
VPEISRFFGIIIAVFYDDHNPPHFHARYGGGKVSIEIRTLKVFDGNISPRALGLVVEWASLHKEELMMDWELAKVNQPPKAIEPLK